jgi:GntR family transcriptional regulator/MocR family aminotransferase
LAYLTPSHQFPTGAVLSLPRRLALLDQARRHEAWLVADDYDSEFRYDGPPLQAMQDLDDSGGTICIGNCILLSAGNVSSYHSYTTI